MNEKKIVAAAALTPAGPAAQKLSNRSAWKAVKAMTTNISSTPSLIRTMIVLARADSVTPRISSSMHRNTSTTAGRLMMPVTLSSNGMGEKDRASGRCHPNRLAVSSLK